MKKKKTSSDFLYNYSDILIALLILIIGCLIVMWRVQVIMAYPSTLTANEQTTATQQKDDTSSKKDTATETTKEDTSKDSSTDQEKDTEKDSDKESSNSLFKKGKLTKDVTIKIPSGSLDNAIQALVDAKLFDDANEYNTLCASAGVDPSSIKTGEFTFTKGMSKSDIAIRVTTYK